MSAEPRYWGVVPAAGRGRRMGQNLPKQYLLLAGVPILQRTLAAMLDWGFLAGVTVALHAGDNHWCGLKVATDPRIVTVTGGSERADSVLACLQELSVRAAEDDWVLVHDAARPLVSAADVRRLQRELAGDEVGGLLAQPVSDTVKRADDDGRSWETLERAGMWLAQTPQMFRFGLLRDALEQALSVGAVVTDEASAIERQGLRPKLIAATAINIKLTHPPDIALAQALLEHGE
jgi:2-C-methyl-D-erythritol 4-phosphate cytidylyltransferase